MVYPYVCSIYVVTREIRLLTYTIFTSVFDIVYTTFWIYSVMWHTLCSQAGISHIWQIECYEGYLYGAHNTKLKSWGIYEYPTYCQYAVMWDMIVSHIRQILQCGIPLYPAYTPHITQMLSCGISICHIDTPHNSILVLCGIWGTPHRNKKLSCRIWGYTA